MRFVVPDPEQVGSKCEVGIGQEVENKMGNEKQHWLKSLISGFPRTAREMESLQGKNAELVSLTQELQAQKAKLSESVEQLQEQNRQLRNQIERQAKSKADLVQQVDRRNRIMEELQEHVGKQQAVVEKLTKRLESVQLEREEVYQQYNKVLDQLAGSAQLIQGFQLSQPDKQRNRLEEEAGWRLNMGCGKVKKLGYLNVDIDSAVQPDVVVSLEPALPFASDSFVLIEAYHVIEHVYPWVSLEILVEFWRILKPKGKLAIECPNLESACGWLVQNSDYRSDSQMGMWAIYGDPNPQNPLQMHKWGYTPITLAEIVKQAGFVSIRREVPQTHVSARDFRLTAIKPSQDS